MYHIRLKKFLMIILAFPLRPRYIRCSTVITMDIVEFDWFKTTPLSPKSAAVIEVIFVDWAGVILFWPFLVKFPIFTKLPCCHTMDSWVWPLLFCCLCFWYCYMHTSPMVCSLMHGGQVSTTGPMSYHTSNIRNSTNPWIHLLNEFIYNWKSPISLLAKSCAILVELRNLTHLVIFPSVHISSAHMYVCSM